MYCKSNILKITSAVVLTLALLLPAAVQFTHIFEEHPHSLCTDHSVHLHEQETDCPICDFHLSTFTFIPLEQVAASIAAISTKSDSVYVFSAKTNLLQHPVSRGPPLFS
ncbi:MAG: hypothetical protein K8F54_13875 [Altibacter sp.]|uniref:hypothetical protein n=1 Tax=Altibacter sp. TaxID=2024823 RepID=UPI001D755BB7|nr:hypothetical protein [Altibacter sp.]MBZ0328690.1 hypothetical protein [Altibacter sp.]